MWETFFLKDHTQNVVENYSQALFSEYISGSIV